MSLRLSPFAELLPRAAEVGIIDAWHVDDAGIVIIRGARSFHVEADELIDVLFELTEEHTMHMAAGRHVHLRRPAA